MLTNVEMTTEQAYSLSTSECSEDLLKTETFTDNFLSFEDVGKCENFMDNDPLNFDCSDEVVTTLLKNENEIKIEHTELCDGKQEMIEEEEGFETLLDSILMNGNGCNKPFNKEEKETSFYCTHCGVNCHCNYASTMQFHDYARKKEVLCTLLDAECSDKCLVIENFMNSHNGLKYYHCNQCAYKSNNKYALTQHLHYHQGIKRFQFTDYNCKSTQENDLARHQLIHSEEKPFHCTDCNYKCNQKSSLVLHQRIHSGVKPFHCTDCIYKCNKKSSLVQHQRIHTEGKHFHCTNCNYKCNQKSLLFRHQRVHMEEKPFHCTDCNYRSKWKSSLVQHQRIHTEEKLFHCTDCNYKCNRKNYLLSHERIHSGEKPFHCPDCNYKSNQKGDLVKHQRIHTGENSLKTLLNSLQRMTNSSKNY